MLVDFNNSFTCMNETLYRWTFKFHKVVRQQNSGAVEDFILPYFVVYLRIQKWKNYSNRSTFAKVIVKTKVAQFFLTHRVDVHWEQVGKRTITLWNSANAITIHHQLKSVLSLELQTSVSNSTCDLQYSISVDYQH